MFLTRLSGIGEFCTIAFYYQSFKHIYTCISTIVTSLSFVASIFTGSDE